MATKDRDAWRRWIDGSILHKERRETSNNVHMGRHVLLLAEEGCTESKVPYSRTQAQCKTGSILLTMPFSMSLTVYL